MTAVQLRYMNKGDLPDGLWKEEHDLELWTDEQTGYRCLAIRMETGHLCGYVEVPSGHPWENAAYSDCPIRDACKATDDWWCDHRPESVVKVHGGVTFSGPRPQVVGSGWWFGFDCAHLYDLSPSLLRDGFHMSSMSVYRDMSYVRSECRGMAAQLAEVLS